MPTMTGTADAVEESRYFLSPLTAPQDREPCSLRRISERSSNENSDDRAQAQEPDRALALLLNWKETASDTDS